MNNPLEPGLLSRIARSVRKVALLRASRIGDFLCAIPAFRALRAALPDAEITIITLPMLRDLVDRSPYFDRFVAFPGFPGIAEQFFSAQKAVQFFAEMQAEHYDLAIQMQGSGVYSNPFTLLLGARYTAGFVRSGDSPGRLDAAFPMPEKGHEVQRLLDLVQFLGVPSRGSEIEFPLLSQDHERAEALLTNTTYPLIGLHTSARAATRRWSLSRFLEVATRLVRKYGGTVVVLGDVEDCEAGKVIGQSLGNACLNLAGRTSLGTLGAVIARLSVLITNDTGPAHIGYALRTPIVTIFGGESPEAYGPPHSGPFQPLIYEVPCRPCNHAECPVGYTCLEGVTPAMAVEAAESILRVT